MFEDRIARPLLALHRALESQSIPWYVFGAQAVVVWGQPRMSVDLDVTISASLDALPRLLQVFEEGGEIQPRIDEPEPVVHRLRVLPLIYQPTRLPIDLLFAGRGLEEDFLARSRPIDVTGTPIRILSPEDLLVTKIMAGRAKDLGDVHGILVAQQGRLDLGLVRELLGLLEQALDRRDLLPTLEKALTDAYQSE